MTPADEEVRARDKDLDWHRERRLKEAMDSETRPLIWKLKQADEIAQWTFAIMIALDVAAAILGHFIGARATLYILAFGVVAFRVLLARSLWAGIIRVIDARRERRNRAPAPEPKPLPTKDEVLPEVDTFDGQSIDELARDIAKLQGGKVTRTTLGALGVHRTKAQQELQGILLKSEFLLYEIGSSPNTHAIGAERIADYGENNAITLHPTLLSSPAEDRALVIANAIRRAKQFTVDADPRIQGERSPKCRMVFPSERVPRAVAA